MLSKEKRLAVIIPVYNEGQALRSHFEAIRETLLQDDINGSFLLVDDGSKDNTWQAVMELSGEYDEVSGIRLSRNFGKELALSAGLANIEADLYLFMDSDLQHPPACVKDMMALMIQEDADIVEGIKATRGEESLLYRLIAKNFYRLLKSVTGLEMQNSSDFKLMTREVVDSVRDFNERSVFFRGIVDWVGFRKVQMPFHVEDRQIGESSFSTFRLMRLALNAIFSYTSQPLYLVLLSGFVFLGFAVILGIQTMYNYLTGFAVSGFSTVILLLLITGSMLMMSLGIIGIYLARIYEEVKQRPRYVIQDKVGHASSEVGT